MEKKMGIKIKDDFDLDKLIGFREYNYNKGSYIFSDDKMGIEIVVRQDKFISINYSDYELGEMESFEIPFMLYNLFKMGIIEEVRDE